MHIEAAKSEVRRLRRQVPFRPFALSLENGDRVIVEHPENIGFDPQPNGTSEFCVISRPLRTFSTFDAVSSISLLDSQNGDE